MALSFQRWVCVLCFFSFTLFQGCATIITGSKAVVSIRSNPSEADFTIFRNGDPIHTGTTPQTIYLKKRGKYTIRITKEGYDAIDLPIKKSISGWYLFGNLVFGGLIGYVIVDPLSGAIFTFKEKNTRFTLTQKGTQMNKGLEKEALTILTLDDIPQELRSQLVQVFPIWHDPIIYRR